MVVFVSAFDERLAKNESIFTYYRIETAKIGSKILSLAFLETVNDMI